MTTSRPATFKVTPGPNTARVVMTGEFDRETTKALEHELDLFLADSPSEVEFDMTEVDFIDSGGLEILFRVYHRIVTEGGGIIRVTSCSSAARRTFEAVGMLEAFNFE
jgi:anti-anti-sigma factor